MDSVHRLLRRQLKRHFGEGSNVPEQIRDFIHDVNKAYFEADQDRGMLERSLDLSSQELFQANSEMRALLQAIPDRFYRINSEGLVLSVKGGHHDEKSVHPELSTGCHIQELPGPELGSLYSNALQQLKSEKTAASIEYCIGVGLQRRFFEARLIPLYRDEIVIILRDMTVNRRLEEQFRQAQKMDAFGQLAGGVAHDFNNLLTVIQGNLSMLQADLLKEEEAIDAIEEALKAAQRAGNLTRQLLTFSRRQPIKLNILELNEVVAGMAKMLHRIIGEHINLESRFSSGSTLVRADIGLLEQALLNLAVNARDAMPGGGTLSIATAHVRFSEENLSPDKPSRRVGEFIEISVRDTGVGIPPEHISHLFEPFFTTKEVGKGTGLGLATVFGVVEQHDAWIEVESRLGKGTVFSIYIPMVHGHTVAGAQTDLQSEALGGHETILLVEDEHAVRSLVTRWLEKKGYSVICANSGPAALRLWPQCKSKVDLLITDMVMPDGMNGCELAAELCKGKPQLKVIQCSGYAPDELQARIPKSEAWEFVSKPFDRAPFLQKVRTCLDRRR